MSQKIKVPLDNKLPDSTEHYILFDHQPRTHARFGSTNIYYQTRSFSGVDSRIGMTPADVLALMSRLHNALRITVEAETKSPTSPRTSAMGRSIDRKATRQEIRRHLNDIANILEI